MPSVSPVSTLNPNGRSHSPVRSIESDRLRAVLHLDDLSGPVLPQNQQPTESQNITSPNGLDKRQSRHTEIQVQLIRSGEHVMPHCTPSPSNQNISESSLDSHSNNMLTNPGASSPALPLSQCQQHFISAFPRTKHCRQERSNTQSRSAYLNENGNQNPKIASSSNAKAHPHAHGIQDGTRSIAGSDNAIYTRQSHRKQDLRSPTHVIQQDGPAQASKPAAVNPDYRSQKIPSVLQQQNSTNEGQAVPHMKFNREVHGNSSTVFQNSMSVKKVRFPIQGRRYPRPRGVKKKFHCSECPDFFWARSNRDRHLLKCHPIHKLHFRCESCSASYGTRSGKTKHIRRAHSDISFEIPRGQASVRKVNGRSKFFCYYQDCEKNYTEICSVYRHVEMDHLKIRYRCQCGYEATTRYNLQTHQNRKNPCS